MTEKNNMILSVNLNLDDLWCGDHWGTTVGELVKDALKNEIKAEIKKAVKNDKKFKTIINKYKELAVKEMMDKLEGVKP